MSATDLTVGLLCGSLNEASSNAALLRVAEQRAAGRDVVVRSVDGFQEIAAFDPAVADDPPKSVSRFQDQIRPLDALLIASPEYAAGVAGSLKNALDWLVGDATIYRKLIGVASAGTTGGPNAIEQLVRTISWQGGWVVSTLGVAGPRTKSNAEGQYTDLSTISEIEAWCDVVVDAARGSASERRERLTAVVASYGIDPERFGDID